MLRYVSRVICFREIDFAAVDNKVCRVSFVGNLPGMAVDEAVRRLPDSRCGSKSTFCPDQPARRCLHFIKPA